MKEFVIQGPFVTVNTFFHLKDLISFCLLMCVVSVHRCVFAYYRHMCGEWGIYVHMCVWRSDGIIVWISSSILFPILL